MAYSLRVLILFILLGLCAQSKLCESQTCGTTEQDAKLCKDFTELSKLPKEMLFSLTDVIKSMFGGISTDLINVIISNFGECVFNPTDDETISKSFKFILFKPDTDQAETFDGTDMLNGCHALRPDANSFTKTIWLWPGWLSNCLKINEILPDFNQRWELEYASKLAKQANAQVIAIDWGSSELSCCSYPLLLFCHMNKISDWMTKIIRECSTIGHSTLIANTWFIGHSLGAQFFGSVTQKMLKIHKQQVGKLIGLDPSGPLFVSKDANGMCRGIQKGYANQTIIFFTNPGELGTQVDINALGDVGILCNKKKKFCQIGCDCNNSLCNHFYASHTLLGVLVEAIPFKATYLSGNTEEEAYISIYEQMKSGLYDLDIETNYELKKSMRKHEIDEL